MQAVLLLLPVVAFGLTWVNVTARRSSLDLRRLSWRGTFVVSFLLVEVAVLLIDVATSVGRHLTPPVVAVAWAALAVGLLVAGRRWLVGVAALQGTAATVVRRSRAALGSLPVVECVFLGCIVVVLGVLAVVAVEHLPSNPDSLVYHLARVEHWVQERTVAPFATHYLPQIEFPPLDEYNLTVLHLLGGTDRFDALVALGAFAVCIVGVSELARLLGASGPVQVLAALVCATLPSGVLLSTSTENDCFAAAVGVGILVLLAAVPVRGRCWRAAALVGASAGLAYLSKTTVPVMLAPAGVVLVILAVRRRRRAGDPAWRPVRTGGVVGVALACALVVVAPFTAQNVAVFGSPVGPASTGSASSDLTADAVVANVTRSLANNFDVGNGRSGLDFEVSRLALGGLHAVFARTHITADDTRYGNTPGADPFVVRDHTVSERTESRGANPWQLLLFGAALVALSVAALRRRRWAVLPLAFGAALVLGWVAFYASARWGPGDARYGLVILVPVAAVTALGLSTLHRWVGRVVGVALLLACLPQLVANGDRPLVPSGPTVASPIQPYLVTLDNVGEGVRASDYAAVAAVARATGCHDIGITNWVEFEYPLWMALRDAGWRGTVRDTGVTNATRSLESHRPTCLDVAQAWPGYRTPAAVNLQFGRYVVSVPAAAAGHLPTRLAGIGRGPAGVRVFAGAGWVPSWVYGLPGASRQSTLVVSSAHSGPAVLHINWAPTFHVSSVVVRDADGRTVPSVTAGSETRAAVELGSGLTQFGVTVASIAHPGGLTAVTGVSVTVP